MIKLSTDYADGTTGHCGGFILDEDWVVTAAHCVEGTAAAPVTAITASYGGVTLNPGLLRLQRSAPVETALCPDAYTGIFPAPISVADLAPTGSDKHDIALLRLQTPIATSTTVRPADIASASLDMSGRLLRAAGFGHTETQSISPDLLWVEIAYRFTTNDGKAIVVGDDRNSNTACQGDSGSPIHVDVDSDAKRYVLGVLSYTFPNRDAGCRFTGNVNGYTLVQPYLDAMNSIRSACTGSGSCLAVRGI